MNVSTQKQTNKKDSNNFDETGEKISIAKKRERKNAQLFCFASL